MRWMSLVIATTLALGCGTPGSNAPDSAGSGPIAGAPRPMTPSATPRLSEASVIGTFVGEVPGSPGESATLSVTVDKTASLIFTGSGGAQKTALKGTWSIDADILRLQIDQTDGKADRDTYIFILNEEGNVLAGNNQTMGEQGPMLSLKRRA